MRIRGSGAGLTVLLRVAADVVVFCVSLTLAFLLRFDGEIPARYGSVLLRAIPLALAIKVPVFMLFRTHRFSWRHVGLSELFAAVLAAAVGSSILASVMWIALHGSMWGGIPRSVLAIDFLLTSAGVVSVRVSRRLLVLLRASRAPGQGRRTLVVGAGEAGAQLVRAIQENVSSTYRILGFIDDDAAKRGLTIHGVRVLGPRQQLGRYIASREIVTVLIAMPTAGAAVLRDTVERARENGVTDVKILPSLSELYAGRVTPGELREVHPEDLLKRDPVHVESARIQAHLAGRTVLITGAAGSIGSELCRQVMRFGAGRVVAVDVNETGLFYLEDEMRRRFPNRQFRVEIADVREEERVQALFSREAPGAVYHAAAYKHVPLMEAFPVEAVKTNVGGTRVVVRAAIDAGVDSFVLISTDKAVNPTSVMGATKRTAEMIVRAQCGRARTRCVAVRFGNVLGSRGSVLKTFTDQIEQRRPVTVTHPDMKRFFMVTSEAVQLVLQAGVIGRDGDVLVLDMGTPVRILDMVRDLIRLYGLEPERDVPIVFTGIRPGEKLCEELLTAEEGTDATTHERVFVARIADPDDDLERRVAVLEAAAARGDERAVLSELTAVIPTFRSGAG